MLRKLALHASLYAVAPQIPKAISIVLLPVLTRHLTPTDYGVYGLITSYLFFVTALRDLGFGVLFVNSYYRHAGRWKIVWRMLYGHLIWWSLIYTPLLWLVLYIAIPSSEIGNYWRIAGVLGVNAVLFDNVNMLANYFLRFSERPAAVAGIAVVGSVVALGVTYVAVAILAQGYLSWFYSSLATAFVTFLGSSYLVLGRLRLYPIMRFRKRFVLRQLRVSLPMVPHGYSSYLLNSSDRVVLDRYGVPVQQIGIYNIAYNVANYFDAIADGFGMAVTPYYSKLFSRNTRKSLRDELLLTNLLMCVFLASAFLLSLWLREVFYLLVKNDVLRSGYGVGIVIVMGFCYRPMYWSVGMKLSIHQRTSALWRLSFVAGALNVVLNVCLVPWFGIVGSAVITFLSLLYMGFSGFSLRSFQQLGSHGHRPMAWLGLILVATAAVYLLRDVHAVTKGIITGGVVAVALVLLVRYAGELRQVNL